eukprot:Pgem_evm1s1362
MTGTKSTFFLALATVIYRSNLVLATAICRSDTVLAIDENTTMLQACDFDSAGDIGSSNNNKNANDCIAKCMAYTNCANVAWNDYEGGTCWFKSSASKQVRAGSSVWCSGDPPPPPDPSRFSVMSYNTKYNGYPHLLNSFANKIRQVNPTVVGLQECQDRDGLARQSGYDAMTEIGHINYILYDSQRVTVLQGGAMSIPRDNYAERAITWGKYQITINETLASFWVFNTHLPHNHNEAWAKSTHGQIAHMLLEKIDELNATNDPTVVVGDMNPFASDYNQYPGGGFESNLNDNGFITAYIGQGNPGFSALDKILYRNNLTPSNCGDTGTGGSDHPSITCDFSFTS